ncbi:D-glycero-beta-D-manno-heptose 1,7-bisphosphate 7-phosphatase [Desulfovibrio sp. SGI.169]|uniref:D-glycero-beta-D-manno-heptose 1,7-bisphosphate 7-phosphatase n=1 Tax=Desulfovibrio sp. SGI.169 TaxID=3420561 RepID=UPI003D03E846
MSNAKRRAIFLDRDGTLNQDTGYVHRAADWRWLPGVPDALARFKAAGWLLVVVSNQSGIARGMFGSAELHALERWLDEQLTPLGAAPDAWRHCPHLPEITGPCDCRKPAPGMLLRAAEEMGIDLAASWMIGDRMRDARAGLAAGCRAVLLRSGWGKREAAAVRQSLPRTPVLPDLAAACAYILARDA